MGKIASADTVYAQAYLTELGRQYLFNAKQTPRYKTLPNGTTIDLLRIERFSLGDPDINYNLPILPASGDMPDLSGENESSVKGAKGRLLGNLISPGDTNLPKDDFETVEYKSTFKNIDIDLGQALERLKTIYTQQLQTFVDGELVEDGVYNVTPKSYGKNKAVNNELIIMLKDPTPTTDGYRLRIFFPEVGSNYNKMTFQFEKAKAQVAVLQQTMTQTVIPTPNLTAGTLFKVDVSKSSSAAAGTTG